MSSRIILAILQVGVPETSKHRSRVCYATRLRTPWLRFVESAGESVKGRILVVEDNLPNREVMCDWLEANGHEVLSVNDVGSAVQTLKSQELDAVLLDVQLGDEDGLALAMWMRRQEKICAVPVIAVTAQAMVTEQRRFLEAGCNACVSKPVDFKLLAEQLERWMAPSNRLSGHPAGGGNDQSLLQDEPKARRRSSRSLATIALRIQSGGESLEAVTAVINLHGALILSGVNWPAETLLMVTNSRTRLSVQARVVWSSMHESDGAHKLGIEFVAPSPEFWGEQYDPDVIDSPEPPF
jgi:CheY-like chemotaxis protein